MKIAVHNSKEYYDSLVSHIKTAQERIDLHAMFIYPGRVSNTLIHEISLKNIPTTFSFDAFTLFAANGLPAWIFGYTNLFRVIPFLTQIGSAHIARQIIGLKNPMSYLFPFVGRNHMKISVIDNTGYIGGVNIDDAEVDTYQDCMIESSEPKFVEVLRSILKEIHTNMLRTNRAIPIDSSHTILVDAGKTASSIIQTNAQQLIQNAKKSITLITPVMPLGKTRKLLLQASENNIPVTLITSREERFSILFLINNMIARILLAQGQNDSFRLIRRPGMVHAKILIVDNEKTIVGSHNFSEIGVLCHTAEIALCSSDKTLAGELTSLFGNTKHS